MDFIAKRTVGDPARYREDQIAPKFCRGPVTAASICGPDQRIKVTDTSALPFKAICKLFMRAPNGRQLVGTGWLTHANKLITAGHCVFDVEEGGWMDSITVVPGMSGHDRPFGRFAAQDVVACGAWLDHRSRRFDVGAIKLSGGVRHQDFLTPSLQDSDNVTVCGYAGDLDTGIFQYRMSHPASKVDGRFYYSIDTFGGQSGAPVLKNSDTAIGIHNYGGCPNSGSDLFEELIAFVNAW